MFQTFDSPTTPQAGPPRLKALRKEMAKDGLAGFLVPRADAHQGEYVAPHDDRLAWLTGFTGSAGFCIVLPEIAGVFVDGRYTVQVKAQVAQPDYTPVDWPATRPGPWLRENLSSGTVGYDPWLHAVAEIEALEQALDGSSVGLVPHRNLVDRIWADQPAPPKGAIKPYPIEFAGEPHDSKRKRLAAELKKAGHRAAVITLPDSIAWLLNVRGSDIPKNPVPHCFALLHDTGMVDLLALPDKVDDGLKAHLGKDVHLNGPKAFPTVLQSLDGPVRIDPASCPVWVKLQLEEDGIAIARGSDPCIMPKASKSEAELNGTREAHLRDAAAMCRFLHWFDSADKTALTEIDLVTALEGFRRETNSLLDISFDTIAGAGPNGALPHYRVTTETNRTLADGALIVVDSGGQYYDGTTDITRTLVVGQPGAAEKAAYTRVLQGMIAISRLRFPQGVAGMHLDAIARQNLWMAGMDYDHGTGHGVGTYLCVHEGPQRLARSGDVPFRAGMILSNEPGYYREGAFGIRIENLIVVQEARAIAGGDAHRQMYEFETITWVPIETRLIDTELLTTAERDWINAYHRSVRARIAPRLDGEVAIWLHHATEPI